MDPMTPDLFVIDSPYDEHDPLFKITPSATNTVIIRGLKCSETHNFCRATMEFTMERCYNFTALITQLATYFPTSDIYIKYIGDNCSHALKIYSIIMYSSQPNDDNIDDNIDFITDPRMLFRLLHQHGALDITHEFNKK